jgi:hypothetical protein
MMQTQTRQELAQFFGITFAFSWLIWLAGILIPHFPLQGRGLEVLGALGPAVAALYLTWHAEGKEGFKRMVARSFSAEGKWSFLLWASLMLLGLHAASRLIYSLLATNLPASELLASPVMFIPVVIIMFLVGGGLDEEIGWRGYALDRLQSKYSALSASLRLNVVWIVWHLPVFFLPGTNQSFISFWIFILPVIPLGVMMTWVYNNTNKSIFAAALFHTVGNVANELFRVWPTESSPALTGIVILTVLYTLAAVVITVIFGAKTLKRS